MLTPDSEQDVKADYLRKASGVLMGRSWLSPQRKPRLPMGHRIYAIGDIHGKLDCLERLLGLIDHHRARFPVYQTTYVFLGDYVDRGEDVAGVLGRLMQWRAEHASVCLLGNHERALLKFLEGTMPYEVWSRWGGDATLQSYGIMPAHYAAPEEIDRLRHDFRAAFPPAHAEFLHNLPLFYEAGDYLFVHAGLRPGTPLHEQAEEDLLMIRRDFLESPVTEKRTIVHGHTIFATPHIRPRSIGIDTGAYLNGTLTALVLEGDRQEFLSTRAEA